MAALALLAAGCAATPTGGLAPLPRAGDLRVMTWNLLGAQADDSVYSEHAGWAARVDQLQPDVLVLQEAQSEDVTALLSRPATRYTLAAYLLWECDVKNNPEGVAVLVRSGLTVTGAGAVHVGDSCLDPTVRRILAWADVEVGGGPLRVYGTHLTAGGGAAAASRALQVRRVRERIAAADPGRSGRWLLAGDMNFVPGSADQRLMLQGEDGARAPGPVVDTFGELEPAADDPATCPSLGTTGATDLVADPQRARRCGYTAGWAKDDNPLCETLSLCTSWEVRRDTSVRIRIDDVLRPAEGPLRPVRAFVPNRLDPDWAAPGAEWFRLSDHLPYVVDLAVTG